MAGESILLINRPASVHIIQWKSINNREKIENKRVTNYKEHRRQKNQMNSMKTNKTT